jgi:hypothetical protein
MKLRKEEREERGGERRGKRGIVLYRLVQAETGQR